MRKKKISKSMRGGGEVLWIAAVLRTQLQLTGFYLVPNKGLDYWWLTLFLLTEYIEEVNFYSRTKPEYQGETTTLQQNNDKLYYAMLYQIHFVMCWNQIHGFSGDRHALYHTNVDCRDDDTLPIIMTHKYIFF